MPGQSFGGAAVTALSGGWFRISVTGALPEAPMTATIGVLSGGSRQFAGDGVSGLDVYGPTLTQGVDVRPFALTQGAVAGPVIFNPPTALTPGGVAMWAAVAGGPNWGGANVWVSFDGTNYDLAGATGQGAARFGALTAALPAGPDPDTAHVLALDLSASNGTLTSASQAVADASGTLCLIDGELVAFETATPTGPNRFSLAGYLRRGVLGAPIAAHAAGATFVRLDDAIFDFPYLATQAGQQVLVKFQSFNLWNQAATPLSQCNAYAAVPAPAGARAPSGAAWTATGATISNGGVAAPAILITGRSDNPSATAIEFFYRQTGTSAWISAGTTSNAATQFTITSIAASQTYDVAVAYIVGGVLGALQIITGGGGATTGGASSGGAPGTALLNDSAAGAGKTFTCPAGSYAHVDIVLTGVPGAGSGNFSGKGGASTDYGGGGVVIVKGFPVTPAATVFTYTLPSAVGSDATCAATGLSLTAHSGASATAGAPGAGAGASTGNTASSAASVTAYAGRGGGLTDTWDGGGPGATTNVASGAVTAPGPDNVSDNSAGAIPGQGGAGSWLGAQPGGGCNLLIIARS